eukprot:7845598-Ditylum_brightwellii.AAC.1
MPWARILDHPKVLPLAWAEGAGAGTEGVGAWALIPSTNFARAILQLVSTTVANDDVLTTASDRYISRLTEASSGKFLQPSSFLSFFALFSKLRIIILSEGWPRTLVG